MICPNCKKELTIKNMPDTLLSINKCPFCGCPINNPHTGVGGVWVI